MKKYKVCFSRLKIIRKKCVCESRDEKSMQWKSNCGERKKNIPLP
jgi:hypothetical protein